MPITVTTPKAVNGSCTTHGVEPHLEFVGKVLKVEEVSETRNWSDTLDYTDNRTTQCTYALVWLGTYGVPPIPRGERPTTDTYRSSYDVPRELEFFEQFAWVDCTNLFVWRGSDHREAEVDAEMGKGGDPLMWANYIAWQAYQKSLAEKARKEAEARAEVARKAAEAKAQKAATRQSKDLAKKAAAEATLAHCPKKGTTTTVDGFTGKVFWTGVNKYKGLWKASVGVKDNRGEVRWIDASHWAHDGGK